MLVTLSDLLARAWLFFIQSLGTTTLAFWLTIILSAVTGFAIPLISAFHEEGWEGVVKHCERIVRDGVVVSVGICACTYAGLYGWNLVKATRELFGTTYTATFPIPDGRKLFPALITPVSTGTPKPYYDIGRYSDPVVIVEPEHGPILSSRPGETLGKYSFTITNLGAVPIERINIQKKFFLAEKGLTISFKNLGQEGDAIPKIAPRKSSPSLDLDFRSHLNDANEVAANFPGPSMLGVRIRVTYRSGNDGREFTTWKLYTAFPTGIAAMLFTNGDDMMNDIPSEMRGRFFTPSELLPYVVSEEHWASIVEDVTFDAQGNSIAKQH